MPDWVIVVLDTNPRRMPPAAALAKLGVPPAVIDRWQVARRELTRGLKARLRASRN